MPTDDQLKELPQYIKDAIANEAMCIQNFFKIRNYDGQEVPFIFRQPQRLYADRAKGHRFRYVIKARKMGISVRIIARNLYRCAFKKNRHAVMLTHTDDAADIMLEQKIVPLIKNCLIPLGAKIKNGEIFFPATNSRYYIGTAGSKKFGRGDDITEYHFSEFAHWEDPEVMTGVEEACIEDAEGDIETTTNGVNFAKKLWEDSKLGKTRYTPIFLPWYCDPRYSLKGASLTDINDEEKKLIEAFGLSQEQLSWRRGKIRDMSQPELFPQEYPANDAEAFLSSGRMVFDWMAIMRQENHCEEPRIHGFLRDNGERVEVIAGNPQRVKVWKVPQDGHQYIIGGDIAEGLEDGAYSVGEVIDLGDGTQVAEWHGHIDPDLFGDELVKLARYYNNALLVPEAWPGPGAVTMQSIIHSGYRHFYTDPKKQRFKSPDEPDSGWKTTLRSKQDAILSFAAAVRDSAFIIKSKELISEMRSFVYNEKGHMVPSLGCYSDRVMAAAIGWKVGLTHQVKYDAAKVNDVVGIKLPTGFSVPQWRGNVMGVRKD